MAPSPKRKPNDHPSNHETKCVHVLYDSANCPPPKDGLIILFAILPYSKYEQYKKFKEGNPSNLEPLNKNPIEALAEDGDRLEERDAAWQVI